MNLVYIPVLIVLLTVYVWTFYQIPIMATGVIHLRRLNRKRKEKPSISMESLPTVSIVVPVKDEEKVVGRLLEALLRLDYPREKVEIFIV